MKDNTAEIANRSFVRRARDMERMAMQYRCPVCGARAGEVCSPLPVYPESFGMVSRRVHEIRYQGEYDFPVRIT